MVSRRKTLNFDSPALPRPWAEEARVCAEILPQTIQQQSRFPISLSHHASFPQFKGSFFSVNDLHAKRGAKKGFLRGNGWISELKRRRVSILWAVRFHIAPPSIWQRAEH